MKKFLILDGNSLIHRAFHALPLLSNRQGVFTNAVLGFTTMLFKLIDQEKPDFIAVAFDEGRTFRHEEYEAYKGQRKPTPEELRPQFPIIKKILMAMNIQTFSVPGYEADDVIGNLSQRAENEGLGSIVVTGDRDSLQLVSDLTSVRLTKKGISEIQHYELDTVQKEFGLKPFQLIDVKALMGDKSDNIPGVPGIGEKTAVKLIQEFGDLARLMDNLDKVSPPKLQEKLRQFQEQAWTSRMLAEIRRDLDIEKEIEDCVFTEPDYNAILEIFEELEFRKLSKEILAKMKESPEAQNPCEELEYCLLDSAAQLQKVVDGLISDHSSVAVYFTEEDSLPGDIKVSWLAFCNKKQTWVMDFQASLEWKGTKNALKGLFSGVSRLVLHEAKKMMWVLAHLGIEINADFDDTQLAAYLMNPSASEYEIQQLSREYLGKTIIEGDNEPNNCAVYANAVLELNPVLQQKLEENCLIDLYRNVEIPLETILFNMESNGVCIDLSILDEMSKELGNEIDKVSQEIYEMAGEKFNINSPRQLGEILFGKLGFPSAKKTKTGYSTSAAVLEELAGKHDIVDKVLFHRQLVKLKSTYVDGLTKLVDRNTGRIHTTFNQTITATGRLSSTEPNLQNIPIRLEMGRKIRKVFVPRQEKWVLLAADYSQVELRVMAHLSKDENLIRAFQEREDIHSRTASQVFGVDLEDVDSNMRRMAKAVNFGIIYGISDFGLSRDLGISRKEAGAFIDRYFASYPGVRLYLDRTIAEAREKGYVTTILNRRRYLPDLFSSNRMVRNFGERTAMNTPIQGSAADIMKLAMLKVDRDMRSEGIPALMLLQVHDELIFEVREKELNQAAFVVKTSMENAYDLDVPLEVDMKFGKNWYEMQSLIL